jgi:hypothetical protein
LTAFLKYTVEASITNADVELSMPAELNEDGSMLLNDIRLVDHDIILARKDVGYENPPAQNFSTNVSMSLAGSDMEFTRGYTAVDAQIKVIEDKKQDMTASGFWPSDPTGVIGKIIF